MNFGLSSTSALGSFAETVVNDLNGVKSQQHDVHGMPQQKVESKQARKALERWVAYLMAHCQNGMPPLAVKYLEDEDGGAEFDYQDWTLDVGVYRLRFPETRVAECQELASTIYHELRHAEQYYAMAYYLAVAYPHRTAEEIRRMLGDMALVAVQAARARSQPPQRAIYDFGKAVHQGEFKGWNAKVDSDCRTQIKEFEKWLGARERPLKTYEVLKAGEYVTAVDSEIRAYNGQRPTAMPANDSTWSAEAGPEFKVFASELAVAFKDRQETPDKFYKAYQLYLGAKKLFALTRWKKAHEKYMRTTCEDDAYTLEAHLRHQCESLGLQVDRATVRGIPDPVLWKAPPPPPKSSTSQGKPTAPRFGVKLPGMG